MSEGLDKDTLLRYLRSEREALLWKLEGLGERELRLPRTPTGTSLLGLIKHCAGVEHGYVVESFGRTSPAQPAAVDFEADPNGDFRAAPGESAEFLIAQYRAVGEAVEAAAAEMDLDTQGHVPWWGDRGDVTLGRVLVHLIVEVARHAGQADILRESIDGAAGLSQGNTNLWEPEGGWTAYTARLRAEAEEAGPA